MKTGSRRPGSLTSAPTDFSPLVEWGGVVLLLAAATVMVTWPQARVLGSAVNDYGDPLLNAWTLAWVARTLPLQPATLFDANIFHPEPNTLALSEPLILPALVIAPVWWIGRNAVLCHNLTLLSGYVLSGVSVYALVRRLTADRRAALVAALAFGISPVRTDLIPRVQLQLTYFMPLAWLALHRWLESPSPARAGLVGVLAGLQALTCLYYGVYFGLLLVVVAAVAITMALGTGRVRPRAVLQGAGAALLGVTLVTGWLVPRFLDARRQVGERSVDEIARSGAVPSDYLRAHPANAWRGDPDHPGVGERRLFPGYTVLALAMVGAFGPASLPYAAGALFAFDASRGFDGVTYRWLFDAVPVLRGLRVPARFGVLVALCLAVLAGQGAKRVLALAGPAAGAGVGLLCLAAVALESRNVPLRFSPVPAAPGSVHTWLARQPPSVLLEFPIGSTRGRIGPQDPTYMHASTWHWHRLVNGYSGFFPATYLDLVARLRDFPSHESLQAVVDRHVDLLIVHEAYYVVGDYRSDVERLDRSPLVSFEVAFRNADGSESRIYRVRP